MLVGSRIENRRRARTGAFHLGDIVRVKSRALVEGTRVRVHVAAAALVHVEADHLAADRAFRAERMNPLAAEELDQLDGPGESVPHRRFFSDSVTLSTRLCRKSENVARASRGRSAPACRREISATRASLGPRDAWRESKRRARRRPRGRTGRAPRLGSGHEPVTPGPRGEPVARSPVPGAPPKFQLECFVAGRVGVSSTDAAATPVHADPKGLVQTAGRQTGAEMARG